MGCNFHEGGLVICTGPNKDFRRILRCPICKARRRMVLNFGGWYGDLLACCGCGNEWGDGYRITRLRTEKAKTKAIAKAKARWAAANPAAEYEPFARAYFEPYLADAS